MDKSLDTIRWFLTAIVMLIVVLYAVSALSCGEGTDYLAAYLCSLRQSERLDEDKVVIYRSMEANQSIIAQLIDGQMSLPEAAAALREEDESRPEHLRLPAYNHVAGLPIEERYMHQLLIRANNELENDPRRDQVMKRLQAELRAYRDRLARPVSTVVSQFPTTAKQQ